MILALVILLHVPTLPVACDLADYERVADSVAQALDAREDAHEAD